MKSVKKEHKYLQVAEGIEKLIAEDVLHIGDKLPSVRILSEEQGISVATVFQAYYHLEGKGLIESRPQSGYYVRFTHRRFREVPKMIEAKSITNEANSQQMISALFKDRLSEDVIDLSLSAPDIHLLPAAKLNKSVIHALRASAFNCLNYEDKQGYPELRKQIAKLSLNWNGRIKNDEVIVTAGCMEAVSICLRAVAERGSAVAIESPTFFGIIQLIQNLGMRAIEIPTDSVSGIDLQYLEEAIAMHDIKACVFVSNFNNPLGSCLPDDKKKLLVELITKHEVPLIEDDIYGELYFKKQRPKTCKSYDKAGLVLYCSSFSKSLAPGYRIGWCIPGKFMEKVRGIKLSSTLSTVTLQQHAIAHFLAIGRYEYHLRNLRKQLYTQCLRYIQAITEYFPADVRVTRPLGGFVLWLELNNKIDAYSLYKESIKYKISIAPGQIFSSQGHYKNFIRIGFGKPFDKKVETALKTLALLIKREAEE